MDEDNEANRDVLIVVIVGTVVLFALFGLVIYKIIKNARDLKAKIEQKALSNN